MSKMNKTKKIIATILATFLTFSMFGCSGFMQGGCAGFGGTGSSSTDSNSSTDSGATDSSATDSGVTDSSVTGRRSSRQIRVRLSFA